jgi:hypothetical protein
MRLALAAALGALAALPSPAGASGRADATRLLKVDSGWHRSADPRATAALTTATDELQSCKPGPADAPDDVVMDAENRGASLLLRHKLAAVRSDYLDAAHRMERYKTHTTTVRRAAHAVAVVLRDLRTLGADPPDICDYYDDWDMADWDPDFHAVPAVPELTAAERSELTQARRTIVAAGKSFKHWGVDATRVEDFVDTYDVRFLSLPDV